MKYYSLNTCLVFQLILNIFFYLFAETTQKPHRHPEVLAATTVDSRADATQADVHSTLEIEFTQEPHAMDQALTEQDLNSRVETTPEGS